MQRCMGRPRVMYGSARMHAFKIGYLVTEHLADLFAEPQQPPAPAPAADRPQQQPRGQPPDSFLAGLPDVLTQHALGGRRAAGQQQRPWQQEKPLTPPAVARGDNRYDPVALLSRHALGTRPERAQQCLQPDPVPLAAAAATEGTPGSSLDPMAILLSHTLGGRTKQQGPQQQQPRPAPEPAEPKQSSSLDPAPGILTGRLREPTERQQQQQQPLAVPAAVSKASPVYDPVLMQSALPERRPTAQPAHPPADDSRSACMESMLT